MATHVCRSRDELVTSVTSFRAISSPNFTTSVSEQQTRAGDSSSREKRFQGRIGGIVRTIQGFIFDEAGGFQMKAWKKTTKKLTLAAFEQSVLDTSTSILHGQFCEFVLLFCHTFPSRKQIAAKSFRKTVSGEKRFPGKRRRAAIVKQLKRPFFQLTN